MEKARNVGVTTQSKMRVTNLKLSPLGKESELRGQGGRGGRPLQKIRPSKKHILGNRGKQNVAVKDIKRTFPRLRQFSNSLVSARIEEAELAYLPRRKKSKVAKEYLEERVGHCRAAK